MSTLYLLPSIFVLIVWAGRLLNYSWAYKVGIPLNKFELPLQALEIKEPLDVRFFLIHKNDHIAIKEGYFWHPDGIYKTSYLGLHYYRNLMLRVIGTVESTADGKAVLTTVAWSPWSTVFIFTMLIHLLIQIPQISLAIELDIILYNAFIFLLLSLMISLMLKITYDESKIVSDIINRRFSFALNLY